MSNSPSQNFSAMASESPIRFAFAFGMASGHINPSLPVARALVKLGHEAGGSSGSPAHGEFDVYLMMMTAMIMMGIAKELQERDLLAFG